MPVTATSVTIYDPHFVVDGSTTNEIVVHGPLTLGLDYDEAGNPARYLVISTMLNRASGESWYLVAYHVQEADAEDDLAREQAQVRICASEPDEYDDMHVHAALVRL